MKSKEFYHIVSVRTFKLLSFDKYADKRYPADCLPDIYINSKHF